MSTVISDSPTSYLCLCTGVRTNDYGAFEWGARRSPQATRRQLKAMLLLPRTMGTRSTGRGGWARFCFGPADSESGSAATRPVLAMKENF